MLVNIMRLNPLSKIPEYANPTDAGMDLTATSKEVTDDYIEYGTGLAMEIPAGYMGLLFPRSSNSKQDLLLCNAVGVVDPSYRGEIKLRFKQTTPNGKSYEVGDRVAQLIVMPHPTVFFEEVFQLSTTVRGDGGFGSSGL